MPDIDDDTDGALVLPGISDNVPGAKSLQDNVARHSETLDRLAQNLRKLGMNDGQIDAHVVGIFDEYRRELALNLERLSANKEALS